MSELSYFNQKRNLGCPFLKYIFILCFILTSSLSFTQLKIEAGLNKKELKSFFENGASIEIKKIKFKGSRRSIGTFKDSDSIFNMYSGLVLSSGSVKKIAQNNNSQSTSSKNFKKGYKPLSKISKSKTKDAAIIEITFIPKSEFISFNYVFGSEEYPEFVSSSFNDVFAFFLKPHKGKIINLAKIPNSDSEISINSVNHINNQCYYVNNSILNGDINIVKIDTTEYWSGNNKYEIRTSYNIKAATIDNPKIPVEFDGFTKLMQAKTKVEPGKTYKLTICIADANDRVYDTAVLIEAGSLLSNPDENYKYGALSIDTNYYFKTDTVLIYSRKEEMVEICNDTICKVFYKTNEFKLTKIETEKIRLFLEQNINKNRHIVSIEAYTDEKGSVEYNQILSQNRNDEIINFIESLKLSNATIENSIAKGKDFDSLKTDAQKRRTEIYLKCK